MGLTRRTVLLSPLGLLLSSVYAQTLSLPAEKTQPEEKTLIIFYSHSGTAAKAAEILSRLYNAETFEIKTLRPYDPYSARQDRVLGKLPAVHRKQPRLKQFSRVILVFPVWGYTVALPMQQYLEHLDFKGKEVIAVACGYGRLGNTFDKLEGMLKGIPVAKFISLYRCNQASDSQIKSQLKKALGNTIPARAKVVRGIEADPAKKAIFEIEITDKDFARKLPRTAKFSYYSGNMETQVKPTDASPGYLSLNKRGTVFYNGVEVGRLTQKIPMRGLSEDEPVTIIGAQ